MFIVLLLERLQMAEKARRRVGRADVDPEGCGETVAGARSHQGPGAGGQQQKGGAHHGLPQHDAAHVRSECRHHEHGDHPAGDEQRPPAQARCHPLRHVHARHALPRGATH